MTTVKTKRILYQLFAVAIVFVLFLGIRPLSTHAAANDWHIELDGTATGKFQLNSNVSQLFHVNNIAPGDQWTGKIYVTNNASDKMEISVVSVVSKLQDTMLFDALTSKLSIDGKTIYDGTFGFNDPQMHMTNFCTIPSGKTIEIDVLVSLPRSVGNTVMGKQMKSTWTFEARYAGKLNNTEDVVPTSELIVYYVDENGNDLSEPTYKLAEIGSTVTEYAKDIEGYIPDKEEKSIRISRGSNTITFVYSKEDDNGQSTAPSPDQDNNGSSNQESDDDFSGNTGLGSGNGNNVNNTDNFDSSSDGSKKHPPKTGYDLSAETDLSSPLFIVFFLTIISSIVIYLRVLVIKRRQRDTRK